MKRQLALLFSLTTLASVPLLAGMRRYALVLEDAPVAKTVASRDQFHSTAALAARTRIATAQRSLRAQLAERGIKVTGSVDTVLNAVFVQASSLDELKGLPGVRVATRLWPLKRQMDEALSMVHAQAAWQNLAAAGKEGGAGVKIAILDTGIDQTHPAFQDPSLNPPAGYPVCSGSDCAFTNRKVIVARSYVSMMTTDEVLPADDLSPRDRTGHGTAAAMIAAGVQHTSPRGTVSGVAPKAFLGNYRIFGSPMINDLSYGDELIAALNDALSDHMDIAVAAVGFAAWYRPESTGAECNANTGETCDVVAQAVENAIAAGMAVVVSAGNGGDIGLRGSATSGAIFSPGTAPNAVTVGAGRNGHLVTGTAGLTAADAPVKNTTAFFGNGTKTRVEAPVRDVAALDGTGLACSALGAGSLSGAIALVQRGDCDFPTKVANLVAAGAVGVLIYRETGGEEPLHPASAVGPIPVAVIGNTDGTRIKQYLAAHPGAQGVLDPELVAGIDLTSSHVASFSSRGPDIAGRIKPELIAPGSFIYTAAQRYDSNGDGYDASGYMVVDGTSFSASLVAGAMALVKQKNPAFDPARLKSAVVNTASADVIDQGVPARVPAAGAGRLDAEAAVKTNVTVQPATLSIGVVDRASIGSSYTLTVRNGSTNPVTLSISGDPDPALHLNLSATTVPAGQTLQIAVTLSGSVPAPGSYQGAIAIRGGAVDLRVPYLYLVGDGVPYDAYALQNDQFAALVDSEITIALRLVDRYGVAVEQTPVTWRATRGGPYVNPAAGSYDATTKKYGIAAAFVILGPAGPQAMAATIGTGGQALTFPFSGQGFALPTISSGGIVDSASYQVGTASRGLAPGSLASIFGQNLATSSLAYSSMLPPGDPRLPIALGWSTVTFRAPNGLKVVAPILYAGQGQLNVQIPWEFAGQPRVDVRVTNWWAFTPSDPYTLYLADAAPGLFEYSGYAIAVDAENPLAIISATNRARKGKWHVFYANGLGPVDTTPATGAMTPGTGLAHCRYTPEVTIGGKTAEVYFAGLVPTGIGYYQINARIPDDTPSGDQPVVVRVNGVVAKTVSLPIQ